MRSASIPRLPGRRFKVVWKPFPSIAFVARLLLTKSKIDGTIPITKPIERGRTHIIVQSGTVDNEVLPRSEPETVTTTLPVVAPLKPLLAANEIT